MEQLHRDLTDFGTKLPLAVLGEDQQKATKEKYAEAAANFKLAADEQAGAPKRYVYTAKATATLREVGLWIPFASVADPAERDRMVRQFLDLEDRALALSNAVYAATSNGPDAPFQLGREQWRYLPGSVSAKEAEIRCASLAFDGTKSWRLPELTELWRTQAVLKDTKTNPSFGKQAEKMAKVWTGTKAPGDNQQYYVDFKTAKIEITNRGTQLETVCVGEMEDGS